MWSQEDLIAITKPLKFLKVLILYSHYDSCQSIRLQHHHPIWSCIVRLKVILDGDFFGNIWVIIRIIYLVTGHPVCIKIGWLSDSECWKQPDYWFCSVKHENTTICAGKSSNIKLFTPKKLNHTRPIHCLQFFCCPIFVILDSWPFTICMIFAAYTCNCKLDYWRIWTNISFHSKKICKTKICSSKTNHLNYDIVWILTPVLSKLWQTTLSGRYHVLHI